MGADKKCRQGAGVVGVAGFAGMAEKRRANQGKQTRVQSLGRKRWKCRAARQRLEKRS